MRNSMNKAQSFWFSGFIFLLIISCGKKKQLVQTPLPQSEIGVEELVQKVNNRVIDFDWMMAKVSASVETEENSRSFNSSLRMRRDSVMLVSATAAMGVEAARILLKQDSAGFLDRMNKKYYYGDYAYLNKLLKTEIDYDFVQSIIVGGFAAYDDQAEYVTYQDSNFYFLRKINSPKVANLLAFSEEEFMLHDAAEVFDTRFAQEDLVWKLRKFSEAERTVLLYVINGDFKIEKIIFGDVAMRRYVEIWYRDFNQPDDATQLFAHEIRFKASNNNRNSELDLSFSRVRLNREIGFSFNIPDRFDEIKKEDIQPDHEE